MEQTNELEEKVILAALQLFLKQGIKKTSMDEVAVQAGVTRVTVYRYFSDKKTLVQNAFERIEQVFHRAALKLEENKGLDIEVALGQIGQELQALPTGDLSLRLEELKLVYPDIFQQYQETRHAAFEALFNRLAEELVRQDLLRPGLKIQFVKVFFWEIISDIFESPGLRALNLSNDELYIMVKDIFLHGIIKEKPGR